jgi:PEP-CTERM motif
MRSRLLGAAALAVALTVSTSAQAQPLQLFFATSGGVFTNTFAIPVIGGTVDIQVYINDTGAASSFFTGPNPSSPATTMYDPNQTQNLNTYNLRGGSFRVTSGTPSVAAVASASAITPNPAFSFVPIQTVSGGQANLSVLSLGGLGVSAGGTGRILLGTFRFTGLATGTTNLTFSDNDLTNQGTSLGTEPPPANPPPVSNGGGILDPTPSGTPPIPGLFSTTASIIVGVPEPTSLVLVGLGVAGLGWVRRRKTVATV